jgi:type I restriction enzyme S subunit
MLEHWERVTLDEIADTVSVRGHQAQAQQYSDKGKWPIIDQGQSKIVGYTDVFEPIRNPMPLVLFGDHTRIVKLIENPFVVGADGVKLLTPKPDRADPAYLHVLVTLAASQIPPLGYSRHFKALKAIVLPLPPLVEQRKIAAILRAWDQAIEKLDALRTAKAAQLEGLIARLIDQADAPQSPLRDHIREVSIRNRSNNISRILSVTNSSGFVLSENQFAHRVASADISNYKIVRRGQYAYNPSRINVGSIARLVDWAEGALSPMYVVFEIKETLDSDYFIHWLGSSSTRKRISLSAQGSVRETVSFGDFASISIGIPALANQQIVARALSAAKAELLLLDREIEVIARQKRGLMQNLLTGEWRVTVDSAPLKNPAK